MKTGKVAWSKSKTVKSVVFFALQFIVLLIIALVLLFWGKLNTLAVEIKERGTDYLYMAFCLLLLIVITYLYFFFEGKHVLESGKNIALVFTILDVYLVVSFIIGKTSVYARPVALLALLTFMLIGRRLRCLK